MIDSLETQHTDNQDVELLQQNVKKFAKVLEGNPLLDGVFLEDIDLLAGPAITTINHKLGRKPRGWILTDVTSAVAAPLIYRISWDDKTIELMASLVCNVSLWVF